VTPQCPRILTSVYALPETDAAAVCGPVLVEVWQEIVEFLEVNGYLSDRTDAAIAAAVSRFLVDSASG
jgi:hypothetical protein